MKDNCTIHLSEAEWVKRPYTGCSDYQELNNVFKYTSCSLIPLVNGMAIFPGDTVVTFRTGFGGFLFAYKVLNSEEIIYNESVFEQDSTRWTSKDPSGFSYFILRTGNQGVFAFEPGTRVANRNGKIFVTAVEQFKDRSFTYCHLEGGKGLYLIPTDELKEVQFEDGLNVRNIRYKSETQYGSSSGFGGRSFDQVWFEESAEVPLDAIRVNVSEETFAWVEELMKTKVASGDIGDAGIGYDIINRPRHYMLLEGVEVRDICKVMADRLEDKGYSAMFISDYIQMMQYLLRFDEKNGLEDVKKSRFYLDKLIESKEDHKNS